MFKGSVNSLVELCKTAWHHVRKAWYAVRRMGQEIVTLTTGAVTTVYTLYKLGTTISGLPEDASRVMTFGLAILFTAALFGGIASAFFIGRKMLGRYRRCCYGDADRNKYLLEVLEPHASIDVFEENPYWWDVRLAQLLARKHATVFVRNIRAFESAQPECYAALKKRGVRLKEWGDGELGRFLPSISECRSQYILGVGGDGGPDDRLHTWTRTEDGITDYELTRGQAAAITRDFHKIICRLRDGVDKMAMPLGYWLVYVSEKNLIQKSIAHIYLSEDNTLHYRGIGLSTDGTRLEFRWRSTLATFLHHDTAPRLLFYTAKEHVEIRSGTQVSNLGYVTFQKPEIGAGSIPVVNGGYGQFFDLGNEGQIAKDAKISVHRVPEQPLDEFFSNFFTEQFDTISAEVVQVFTDIENSPRSFHVINKRGAQH